MGKCCSNEAILEMETLINLMRDLVSRDGDGSLIHSIDFHTAMHELLDSAEKKILAVPQRL